MVGMSSINPRAIQVKAEVLSNKKVGAYHHMILLSMGWRRVHVLAISLQLLLAENPHHLYFVVLSQSIVHRIKEAREVLSNW